MSKENMSINVDMGTATFERKLRAIADHATSLADRLCEIDERACPECGGEMQLHHQYADDKLKASNLVCKCGYNQAYKAKE